MQHFYFDRRSDGVLVRDYTGHTLPDLEAAIEEARQMAKSLGDKADVSGGFDNRQIEICNEAHLPIQVISVKLVADGEASD
jgi:hypothetical protein